MMNSRNKNIKIATIISYVTIFLGNIVSLISIPFIISRLGASEYGIFNLVNSIISYMYIMDLGLGNAVVRYNSKYIAEKKEDEIKQLNGMFLCIYFIISIICILIGTILYFNFDLIFSNGLTRYEIELTKKMFIVAIINLSIGLPLGVFNSIITAYEEFIFIKIISLIRTVLNPIIMIVVLLTGYKALGMVIMSTIFNIVLGCINIYYCKSVLKIKLQFSNFNKNTFKSIFKYSSYIFIGIIAYKIYWSTDQFILGMCVSASSIAVYSVGSQLSTYFTSISNVLSGMFLPKFTKISINDDKQEMLTIITKVSRIQYYIAIYMLIGFILVGKQFIHIWIGDAYTLAYYISIIIMIPQVISIVQALFATTLEALNKHKVKSYIYLSVAVLNLFLTIILVKPFGIIGCALGTSVGMTINAIANNLYYAYKLKFNMKYYWSQILPLMIPTILSFIAGWSINNNIYIYNYISLLVFIIIFTISYLMIFWVFGFNKYEKDIFISTLKYIKIKSRCISVRN